MAPRNQRDSVEDKQEEQQVCKKIKQDEPTAKQAPVDSEAASDQCKLNKDNNDQAAIVKETGDGSNKNNNNSNNNNNNNNVQQQTNGNVKSETDKPTTDATNGAKVAEVKVDAVPKDEKPIPKTQPEQPPSSTTCNKTTEQTKEQTSADTKEPKAQVQEQQEKQEDSKEDEEIVGTLLLCGGANWEMTGRKELPKNAKKPTNPAARNLWGPHRARLNSKADKPLRVKGVFSGCNACHSVIITDDGQVMTFGRNEKGQLGLGDTETRYTPVVVEKLEGINIVAASCGRSFTLFLDSDGIVYATGDNKMGQCGIDKPSVQQITTPQRIVFKEAKPIVKLACGAEFSMILDADGRLYSFGHPEHGQLGHNSEGKYFTTGNKYAFHCEHTPRRIHTFISKTREGHIAPVDDVKIIDIACGTNHTLAVDSKRRCFSWGFAGYHRLGHSETKNELVPRSIKVFESPNNPDRGAVRVFAGSQHSMAIDVHGVLYFWGQNKSSGEATMYPKVVQDLCGWKISSLSCANRSIFLAAEGSCVSWGPSPTYGELGYGEGRAKSSTTPDEVKTLDGVHVLHVACGHGHTLLIARDKKPEDQKYLNKLGLWP